MQGTLLLQEGFICYLVACSGTKTRKVIENRNFLGRRHDKLQTIHAIPTTFPSIIIGSRVKPNCSNLSNVMRCHVTHIVYTLFLQSFVHKCWKVCSKGRLKQRALNTWRGRLQHFVQLLNSKMNKKMIVIWSLHLLKSNKFPEFHRCGSKNVPATPIFILNFPRAWQSF